MEAKLSIAQKRFAATPLLSEGKEGLQPHLNKQNFFSKQIQAKPSEKQQLIAGTAYSVAAELRIRRIYAGK